ncbi:hypothetical protein ACFL15_00245 [Patescibacteria group bacterium]
MEKNQKGIAVPVVLIAILIAGIVGYSIYTGKFQPPRQRETTPTEDSQEKEDVPTVPEREQVKITFTQDGNLVTQDDQNWKLLYDDPESGDPAAMTNLSFDENSLCNVTGRPEICDISTFQQGDRVHVEGYPLDMMITKVVTLVKTGSE